MRDEYSILLTEKEKGEILLGLFERREALKHSLRESALGERIRASLQGSLDLVIKLEEKFS